MARDDGARGADGGSQPFEATLEALEAIVTRLETGSLGLEEALEAFEAGVGLARQCEARLDQAERRVELLLRNPDGSFRAEPFSIGPSGTGGAASAADGVAAGPSQPTRGGFPPDPERD